MTAFVRYDIQRSTYAEVPYTDSAPGLRLLFTVTAVQDLPDDGVFVFKKVVNGKGTEDAIFSNVASIVDMANLPYGTPDIGDVWFRTNVLDLIINTEEQADELIVLLDGDLFVLNTGADRTNDLSNPESVLIPSEQSTVTPSGVTIGNDDPTLSVAFPVSLASIPTGRVLVSITPSIAFKITNLTIAGFDLVSSVDITSTHVVRWRVVSA